MRELIFTALTLSGIVGVAYLLATAFGEDEEIKAQMIEKCNPNPSLFECQLYLAEKGARTVNNKAMTGAIVGGMVGGSLTSRGK